MNNFIQLSCSRTYKYNGKEKTKKSSYKKKGKKKSWKVWRKKI